VLLQNSDTVVNWLMQNGACQSGSVMTTGATEFIVSPSQETRRIDATRGSWRASNKIRDQKRARPSQLGGKSVGGRLLVLYAPLVRQIILLTWLRGRLLAATSLKGLVALRGLLALTFLIVVRRRHITLHCSRYQWRRHVYVPHSISGRRKPWRELSASSMDGLKRAK
jgi:hypothetical protein